MATGTAFDFSAVAATAKPVEMPKNGAGRPRTRGPNPFTEVLAASYEDHKAEREAGRSIAVPGKNVAQAVYLIRQAADDLGIGARVVTRNSKGESVAVKDCKDLRGNVTILFAGKDRKASKDAATTESNASVE